MYFFRFNEMIFGFTLTLKYPILNFNINMPNLTKQSVLDHLKEKSNGEVKKYWRLNDRFNESDKEYEAVFFKGNRYSAVLKSYTYLLSKGKGTDMFQIFDFYYHVYGDNDVDCEYDTFLESVDDYIDRFFNGDTLWLSEVISKPIVL